MGHTARQQQQQQHKCITKECRAAWIGNANNNKSLCETILRSLHDAQNYALFPCFPRYSHARFDLSGGNSIYCCFVLRIADKNALEHFQLFIFCFFSFSSFRVSREIDSQNTYKHICARSPALYYCLCLSASLCVRVCVCVRACLCLSCSRINTIVVWIRFIIW